MTAFTTRPEILGTFGVVTSTHWIASAVGMSILEKGGNAFDAAVATGFVLAGRRAASRRPGRRHAGDHLFGKAKDKVEVICAQGPAPAGATIEHYRSEGLSMIPGDGLLATVIPGSFDGWMLMLRDYGRLSVRDVLEPAIYYAENGHPMLPRVADTIGGLAGFFEKEWPTSHATWLPGGIAPQRIRISGTRCSPPPGSASSPRPKRSAVARRRSKRRATPSIAASSPRRSRSIPRQDRR